MTDRSFEFMADDQPFSFSGRVHLSGKDDLSLYPSLFLVEFWNLPEEYFLLLTRARMLSVSNVGACLVSGQISDTFRRLTPEGTITSVAVSAGLDLWEAEVSLTVEAGVPVSEAVRRILADSGTGVGLLSTPSSDPVAIRSGSFFGRAAECVSVALSAARCRAVLTPSGIQAVPENEFQVSFHITKQDLLEVPSFVGGVAHGAPSRMILVANLAGWRPGQTVEVSCGNIHAVGIVLERSIEADTASGAWKSEMLVKLIN